VQKIYEATECGERLTKQLLSFARNERTLSKTQPVNVFVQHACEVADETLDPETEISMDLSPDAGLVQVDGQDLYQAMLSLIYNARDSMTGGGAIEVSTRVAILDEQTGAALDLDPGRYVKIVVRDSGGGMNDEIRSRVFDPFFSTKPIGAGFGLGLTIVEAIVREAKGAVDLQSVIGSGSIVTLYLPSA
jgi:signal transduction histidine kinase